MSKPIWFVAALSLLLSCSPTRRGATGDDDDGSGSGSGSNGFGSSCASDTITAQQIPLDIYIELDQSSSMSDDNKWPSVTSAIGQFVAQPNLDGISVGLGYFAVQTPPPTCSTASCMVDTDCGSAACGPCFGASGGDPGECLGYYSALLGGADSCTVADYETPAVEIAPLPGVASAITSSMGMHSPTTGTPTVQALTGAIDHATTWSGAHAGDAVVVVLATDGEPDDSCTPEDVPSVEAVATQGRMSAAGIRTFVIGVGSDLADLDGIASAGGTGSAFLVDTSQNVLQQFLDAMNAIRHSVLGCTYQIPVPSNGQMPNYQEVNVIYTPGGAGTPVTIPYVATSASCPATGNAWYYNDATNPTQIILCMPTCSTIEADTAGSVAIELGCSTVIQ